MRLFETKWSESREVGALLGKGSKLDFFTILGRFYYLVKLFEAVSSGLLGWLFIKEDFSMFVALFGVF